ncbi:MAG: hypothetical protein K2R98_01475 [Gemmataceae bacterium]|nr:hypothetical protein [Gemmataceae bacterium]
MLRDRKQGVITTQTGDDFLFGDRLALVVPLDIGLGKWANGFERQPDDWQRVQRVPRRTGWGIFPRAA